MMMMNTCLDGGSMLLSQKCQLIEKIEQMRWELGRLAESKGISDPDTLHLSRSLDVLLNQYYRSYMV